jgi:heat shock protein HslJ
MRMAVLMAVLVVAGCGTRAAREPAFAEPPTASEPVAGTTMAKLDGTQWRFVEVAGAPVPAAVTATLRIRDGRISGRAGCNSFGAKYLADADGKGSFSQIMSTKMACVEPAGAMDVGHRIFEALPKVSRMDLADGELALLDAAGKPLARLEPAAGS